MPSQGQQFELKFFDERSASVDIQQPVIVVFERTEELTSSAKGTPPLIAYIFGIVSGRLHDRETGEDLIELTAFVSTVGSAMGHLTGVKVTGRGLHHGSSVGRALLVDPAITSEDPPTTT